MEAVILAAGPWETLGVLQRRLPPPLQTVANVPVLGHHLAACRCAGIPDVHLLLSEQHRFFREVLGEGRRWGVRLVLHRLASPGAMTSRLRTIARGKARRLVVLRDDCLLSPDAIRVLSESSAPSETAAVPFGATPRWGAVVAPADRIARELADGEAREAIGAFWRGRGGRVCEGVLPEDCRSYRSPRDLLELNLEACNELSWLGVGRAWRDGIFLQSNVAIDPTARLVPPILVGRDCRVGAGVVLGPRVVVGEHCFLSDRAVVHDSVVLGHSYIGEGCEVRDAVVDGCGIFHAHHDAQLVLPRSTLLADVSAKGRRSFGRR